MANPVETYAQSLTEQFEQVFSENAALRESLDEVRLSLQLEDRGWTDLWTQLDDLEGLSLEQVQEMSKKIREYMVGGSLIKRGADLRIGYIWGKGINIEGSVSTGRGQPSSLAKFFSKPVNQDSIFSSHAHEEIERAAYADGTLLLIADSTTKTVRRFSISEVTGVQVNPDFPEEVWAYQRTWKTQSGTADSKKVLWYYTNRFGGIKQGSIAQLGGEPVKVAPNAVIIDKRFNRQIGWPLGVPDAVAALAWFRAYSEFLKYGRVVSEALAKLLYKVTSPTAAGTQNAAAKIANMRGTGNTAALTGDQDLTPLSTAGRGYDFQSGRPLAAQIAASLNVSVVALLSDPGAAGSSYGSAQTLEPPTVNAMRLRQAEHKELFAEVFQWAVSNVPDISFDPIVDPDPYREMQTSALGWAMGLIWEDEMRPDVLKILTLPDKHNGKAPDGVMYPNNKNSGARIDIDPNGAAFSGSSPQAASPDQGRNNPAGSSGANDLRTDIISQSLNMMKIDELRNLVERLEAAIPNL